MRRRTWLTGVGLVLALGPGASSAMAAGEVRVGASVLTYEADDSGGVNNISITKDGADYIVSEPAGGLVSGNTFPSGCQPPGLDPNTMRCPGASVQSITVILKAEADELTVNASVGVPVNVTGGPGNDVIRGGSGNDTLRGDGGEDTFFGGGGDDTINTRGGENPDTDTTPQADRINCGAGNDTATIDGLDGFIDSSGNPTSTTGECETVQRLTDQPPPPPPPPGGGGGQQPSVNQPAVSAIQPGQTVPNQVPPAPSAVRCRTATFVGSANADRFLGTPGGDRMVGLAGNDLFDGLAGEDCIYGGDGADTMRGGDGDDRLSGGNGNDRGDGGTGADAIYGSAGVDTLYGRAGNDVVSGGLGSDKMFGENGADRMTGSAGNDRISSGAGNDRIVAGTGRDQVYGSSGNDLIDVRDGSRDVVSCGPGRDTVVRDRRDVLRNCERTASRLPRAR
jgi:Ca2+-binding RTX toxin-like protein